MLSFKAEGVRQGVVYITQVVQGKLVPVQMTRGKPGRKVHPVAVELRSVDVEGGTRTFGKTSADA